MSSMLVDTDHHAVHADMPNVICRLLKTATKIMSYRNWLPSTWSEQRDASEYPLSVLRKRMDEIFEDFDRGWPSGLGEFDLRSNVSETDKEICITADLPGMGQNDIDISISANQITIKGEKKSEKEEKKDDEGRQFRRIERSSGSFERSMNLLYEIDPDKVSAEFKDGVLTVTIPKPPEVVKKTKKIEIKQAT